MVDLGNLCFAAGEPDTLVAIGGAGERTLADLLRDAGAIARSLPPKPQPGDEVLLSCEDRYWFTAGLFGAWLAMFADLFVRGGFFLYRFAGGRWKLMKV